MRSIYFALLFVLMACIGCQWKLNLSGEDGRSDGVVLARFDRAQRLFLTTGDYAALQQMKTNYPIETRTLIEDVLNLGYVDEPGINTRFLYFFQDSTLQALLLDVEEQYHDVSDLNADLTKSFKRLVEMVPQLSIPHVYTQISSLDQSIVVGDSMVGISLDKYLGKDYPIYLKYGFSERQRRMMTRQYIVPDCLGFYLLGHFPMSEEERDSAALRDAHMARIQYVVNRAMGRNVFNRPEVMRVSDRMQHHPEITIQQLLEE